MTRLALILFFFQASSAIDFPIDDFKTPFTNLYGGPATWMNTQVTSIPHKYLRIVPTGQSASYTTQLIERGCFDASLYNSIQIDYVVSDPYATFDVSIEFYDVTCTRAAGHVNFRGYSSGQRTVGSLVFKVARFDSITGILGMSKTLKSIKLRHLVYSEERAVSYLITGIGFNGASGPTDVRPRQDVQPPREASLFSLSPLRYARGFMNAGSTCYVDSLLNALFIQSTAFDYLLKPLVVPSPALVSLQDTLRGIITTMRSSRIVEAAKIVELFTAMRLNGYAYTVSTQEDPNELLSFLLDRLESVQLSMSAPDAPGRPIQSFRFLMVSISSTQNMVRLDTLIANEGILLSPQLTPINSMMNSGVQQRYMQDPRYLNLEQVLPILLKRFNADLTKRIDAVDVPFVLDMTQFYAPRGTQDKKYALKSFVVHRGVNMSDGHFVAYVMDRLTGTWHLFDDADAPTVADQGLMQLELSTSAYILFYELIL